MKKQVYILLVAVVLSIVLSSCKSQEKCPAYSSLDINKVEANS